MLSRKDMIFPGIVLVLLAAITFVFLISFGNDFLKYRNLKINGVNTKAVVADKNEIRNLKPTDIFSEYKTSVYQIIASYVVNGRNQKCKLSVARSTYEVFGIKDEFEITYLPSKPGDCTLPASLELNYYILLSISAVGLLFLLITIGFGYYIYRSFKRPSADKTVIPTTTLDLESVNCPKCKKEMTEGYLPTIGGVSWREKGDPVGIPTILSGLPGTTFWVKRPRLHAFHCDECRVITFKYGKS